MPFESTPRMTPLARVIFLPGIYVPTGEKTPFMPVRALGAPQTTCTGPPPASTMQTLSRSALGCGLASMTEATTKPSYLRLGSSTLSTSRPTRVSVSTISVSEADVSRWSRSQERVNFIAVSSFSGSCDEARRKLQSRVFVQMIEDRYRFLGEVDEREGLLARERGAFCSLFKARPRLRTVIRPLPGLLQLSKSEPEAPQFRRRGQRGLQERVRSPAVFQRAKDRRESLPRLAPS